MKRIRLTLKEREELQSLPKKGMKRFPSKDFGQKSAPSNFKKLQDFINKNFGVEYSEQSTAILLHRLDLVYKQTTNIFSKYDAQVQKDFKDFYEDLEENLPKNQDIVFIDVSHPQHNTQPTRAWMTRSICQYFKVDL